MSVLAPEIRSTFDAIELSRELQKKMWFPDTI